MNFKTHYTKEFKGASTYTSRAEWESAPCPIDMTQVSDNEMKKFIDKFYVLGGEVFFDNAETWLMKNTKAKYLEDYSKKEHEEYGKRAKKLYYA